MHTLNKLFQKVFVITVGLPNERYEYISSYLKKLNIQYEIRVSVNKNFFELKHHGDHNINQSEQSLSSQYASIFYENYYQNIDSFVILEDDNSFCDDFESKFECFFKYVPNDWDVIHLGDYNDESNIKKESVNKYVDRLYLKYTTSFMIFRNIENYKIIADLIVGSQYQIDYVLNHFYINNILKCYSPSEQLAYQLSYRDWENKSENKLFKSLIRVKE